MSGRAGRSIPAIVLFGVGGAGVSTAGVVDADLQALNADPPPVRVERPPSTEQMVHGATGSVGLLSLMAAAGFASRRLRRACRLRSTYRALRILGWLTPVAFFVFLVLVSYGFAGLGQRVFLGLMFAWQLLPAWVLAGGAFTPAPGSKASSPAGLPGTRLPAGSPPRAVRGVGHANMEHEIREVDDGVVVEAKVGVRENVFEFRVLLLDSLHGLVHGLAEILTFRQLEEGAKPR